MNQTNSLNILLADDDKDDCLLFKDALEELYFTTSFTMVHNSEQLMEYLETVSTNLPDALFLDLNMPRKNGFECLMEIKKNSAFNKIPIIIFSTSYEKVNANLLYEAGANYYIKKPSDFEELKNVVRYTIRLLLQNNVHPTREKFYINNFKVVL